MHFPLSRGTPTAQDPRSALVWAQYKRLVFTSTLHPQWMSVSMNTMNPKPLPTAQLGDKKMLAQVLGTKNVLVPSIVAMHPLAWQCRLLPSGNSNFRKRCTFPYQEGLPLPKTHDRSLVWAQYKRLVFTSTLHPRWMSVSMNTMNPKPLPATQLGDKKMLAKVLGTRNV